MTGEQNRWRQGGTNGRPDGGEEGGGRAYCSDTVAEIKADGDLAGEKDPPIETNRARFRGSGASRRGLEPTGGENTAREIGRGGGREGEGDGERAIADDGRFNEIRGDGEDDVGQRRRQSML